MRASEPWLRVMQANKASYASHMQVTQLLKDVHFKMGLRLNNCLVALFEMVA